MIGDLYGSAFETAVSGYESLVGMFGSPAALLALAATLVAIAAIGQYVLRHRKPPEEM